MGQVKHSVRTEWFYILQEPQTLMYFIWTCTSLSFLLVYKLSCCVFYSHAAYDFIGFIAMLYVIFLLLKNKTQF